MERRLAAILVSDVVEYSRLMGEDEVGTIAALRALRSDLFEPVTAAHGGTVIKRMGDGWIVEFPSVSEAVLSAIKVQEGLTDHATIRLRIGVHIGEVTFQDDDIYGDGINVAARLEELAQPGQVLISDTAHHSLDGKAVEPFHGGETHQLKNIARDVAIWRWPADGEAGNTVSEGLPAVSETDDRPSIAVLPFDNMSNDPEQDFFCDGLAEDIITSLSRSRQLFVIARNSSFTYRGASVDIRQVGRDLGVKYVLEGSVRCAGNRVRVTSQLIEADSGTHIWADKYDRPMDDIFAVQDEITANVAGVAGVSVTQSEMGRMAARRPKDLTAYQLGQKASWHIYKWTAQDAALAKDLCIQGIARNPSVAINYSVLGAVYALDLLYGWTDTPPQELMAEAIRTTKKAIDLEREDEQAHLWLAMTYWFAGKFEDAFLSINRCMEINPNHGIAYGLHGTVLAYSGPEKYQLSRKQFENFARLSPRDGFLPMQTANQGIAEMIQGDFEKALEFVRQATTIESGIQTAQRLTISFLALNGDISGSKAELEEYQRRVPDFNWPHYAATIRYLFRRQEDHEKLLEGWRLAGALE